MTKITLNVIVTLRHESGVEQNEDTLLDAFCAYLGEQNGSRDPYTLRFKDDQGEIESVYVTELVDA